MEEHLSRISNENRKYWRVICRKRLSQHIWEALGLRIDPSEVRLKTGEPTQYLWKIDDSSLQPLFEKHLSKHSVGAYKQLCQGVGESFYAIRSETTDKENVQLSLSDRVQTLQRENAELTQILANWMERVSSLQDEKTVAEEKICVQESTITEAQQTISHLQQDVQQWVAVAEYYQLRCMHCSEALKQTIISLQALESTMNLPRST
ncbi:hypothetical protein BDQ94DRAFT_164024 [Aspergillus welwitschiae]|uniref:Uncharacterized protein n=1 Tax=Aspergillus welwitschiae TaxID=1341132 RepID=A0A3F3PJC1_9EURO|nr:hypothetical protein BDQ94DRAFT_164024 [Aspergillus welwitschiae]RDH26988.1 hypothetical protein BDQ94DRAFT_164024 [Aspergillus welwitschiae]